MSWLNDVAVSHLRIMVIDIKYLAEKTLYDVFDGSCGVQ